ncbi:MAG: glycosyltransferase [Bacteroidetes bacterium]|nr:glycosyltransferase [Bacteroidota bacterium]
MSIDITIPVLNEEETLERQVQILRQFLLDHFSLSAKAGKAVQWQIVIADNGSIDSTAEIAQALASRFEEVAFVQVPRKGVGLALKTSWGQSNADIVGYMDLDLATDLKHFQPAIEAITQKGFDIVYASRLHRDSRVIGRSLKREITSRVFNRILQIYLGIGFSDGMCGFKFLKRKHLDRLIKLGADNDGWFFSTELLTVGEWLGLKLYELPVTWTDDVSSSRVKILPLAKRYLASMRKLRKRKPEILRHAAS